jgi:hypothetical protein
MPDVAIQVWSDTSIKIIWPKAVKERFIAELRAHPKDPEFPPFDPKYPLADALYKIETPDSGASEWYGNTDKVLPLD